MTKRKRPAKAAASKRASKALGTALKTQRAKAKRFKQLVAAAAKDKRARQQARDEMSRTLTARGLAKAFADEIANDMDELGTALMGELASSAVQAAEVAERLPGVRESVAAIEPLLAAAKEASLDDEASLRRLARLALGDDATEERIAEKIAQARADAADLE